MLEARGLKSRVCIDGLSRLRGISLEVCPCGFVFGLGFFHAQVIQSLVNSCLKPPAAFGGHLPDHLGRCFSLLGLLPEECGQLLYLKAVLFSVDNPQFVLHVLAYGAMLHKDATKYVIYSEQFLFQDASNVVSLGLNDVSTPHSDNLPLSEVTEEVL